MANTDNFDKTLLLLLDSDPFSALSSGEDSISDISFETASDDPTVVEILENVTLKHKAGFHMAHINAQSLMAHSDYLNHVFGSQNMHVVAVSETWLKPSLDSNLVHIPGYLLFRNDRINKGGGGVAFYVRSDIQAKIISSSPGNYNAKTEYLFIEIILSGQRLFCAVRYRPPKVDSFLVDYEMILVDLSTKYDHIIIA